MPAYRKVIIIGAAIVAVLAAFKLAKLGREENTWQVLVGAFPNRISVENAHISSAYYILRQTHEQILRKDDGQNYTSRILAKWSHDLAYSEYILCPKGDLRFDDRTPLAKESFYEHVSSITAKYEPGAEVVFNDGCAVIKFKAPAKGYLEYLTLYENAPTLRNGEQAELGLGPFRVEFVGEDRIELARKHFQRNAYSKIVLHLYKDVGDPKLSDHGISDFNLIPSVDIPGWVKESYRAFDNIELKTANLIINHPDPQVRDLSNAG